MEGSMSTKKVYDLEDNEGYTQREWDRIVGIGEVPEEYKKREKSYEETRRRYDRG
jgi:hypothetical protein